MYQPRAGSASHQWGASSFHGDDTKRIVRDHVAVRVSVCVCVNTKGKTGREEKKKKKHRKMSSDSDAHRERDLWKIPVFSKVFPFPSLFFF